MTGNWPLEVLSASGSSVSNPWCSHVNRQNPGSSSFTAMSLLHRWTGAVSENQHSLSQSLSQVFVITRKVANAVTLAQGFGSQIKENLPMPNISHPLRFLSRLETQGVGGCTHPGYGCGPTQSL